MEIVASYFLASVLGLAAASLLYWLIPARMKIRAAILVLIPPGLLFAVFLAFFDGAPVDEDWLWLGIGLVYFWPWYLAWLVGWIVARLIRARLRPAAS
ncbi:hypothetical protein [uncultured Erythrobacter sp.]|uniref:hypothetical protein n=1 Tax=uncultured Erythrobacter sp. TaxID=263913 RepID=UPI00260B6BEA|nr:hypothetical protein [uncultured Erythrobacter sp.]